MAKKKSKIPEGWKKLRDVSDKNELFRFNKRSNVQWSVYSQMGRLTEIEAIESGRSRTVHSKILVYMEY